MACLGSSDLHTQLLPPTFDFIKDQLVEVSSDEEGFRGAWYSASILEYPLKSSSRKRRKVLVEYKTLLAENGFSPLTEHVDPTFIRPLPPTAHYSANGVFKENDIVDGKDKDGWWTGVVRKVLLPGRRYRIYFETSSDVLDLDAQDLRLHWDWVNGGWIRPNLPQMTGSAFSSGTVVEVNLDRENVHDAWFPAVVIRENGDQTYFVKCLSPNNDDGGELKVTVDSLHIRPTPPHYADYELFDKVDAPYDFGWQAGVVTKVLAGRRYNVFFMQENEDKELSHSEIRPHADWLDGKWVTTSQGAVVVKQEQSGVAQSGNENPEVNLELEKPCVAKDNTVEESPCSQKRINLMEHPTTEDTSYSLPSTNKKIKLTAPSGNDLHPYPSKRSTERDASRAPSSVTPLESKKMPAEMSSRMNFCSFTQQTAAKKSMSSPKLDQPTAKMQSPSTGRTTEHIMLKSGGGGSSRRKRGRPRKIVGIPPRVSEAGIEVHVAGDIAYEMAVEDHTSNGFVENEPIANTGVSETDSMTKDLDDASAGVPKDLADDDKPLSTWCGGIHSSTSVEDSRLSSGEAVIGLDETREMLDSHSDDETMRTRPIKELIELSLHSTPVHATGAEDIKQSEDIIRAIEVPVIEHNMLKSGGGGNPRRKRGRPRKIVGIPPRVSEAGIEVHVAGDIAYEMAVEDDTSNGFVANEPIANTGVSETDSMTKDLDDASAGLPKDLADDDKPLSKWCGGIHSSTSVEDSRLSSGEAVTGLDETRERQVVPLEPCTVNNASLTGNQTQITPFIKKSPSWKTIETLKVFQTVPQNPHFHPLSECKEEYREVSAIGMMVIFASLAEEICSLQFDDPRSIFESNLKSFVDLEKHGFDSIIPRRRVNELLSMKDMVGELLNESKDAETQVREQTDVRRVLDGVVTDIEGKIMELQREFTAAKSKVEAKDHEISERQTRADDVNSRRNKARHDFEKLATAPWKLP